jgi:hypothetical protein
MAKGATIEVGDRVAYSAYFLRSIGDISAARGNRRGTLAGFNDEVPFLAEVKWDGEPDTMLVNIGNLVLTRRLAVDAAHAESAFAPFPLIP